MQVEGAMRSLASPVSQSSLIRAIFLSQTRSLMAKFELVRRRLAADVPQLCTTTGFEASAADLRRHTPEIQQEIVRHPAFSAWTNAAFSLVDRGVHVRFPHAHPRTHLEQFGAFAVAAAVLATKDLPPTNVRTDSLGAITLSGVGRTADLGIGPLRVVSVSVVRGRLHQGERTLVVRSTRAPLDATPREPLLNLAALANYGEEAVGADGRVAQWNEHAERLGDLFAAIWPELWAEMRLTPLAMRPIRSPGPETHASATLRELPGLMLLSPTPDFGVFAEAVAHEFHHQKLNAIINVEPLTNGEIQDCYSPWRTDARPVSGLLHGAYAFHGVLHFWERVFAAGPADWTGQRQRLHAREVLEQVKRALDELDVRTDLTESGHALARVLRESLCRLEQSLPTISKADHNALQGKLDAHQARWRPPALTLQRTLPQVTAADEALATKLGLLPGQALAALRARDCASDPLALLAASLTEAEVRYSLDLAESTAVSGLARLAVGHFAYRLGEFSRARAAFEQSIGLSGQNRSAAAHAAAFCLRHEGNWIGAEQRLRAL